MFLGHWKSSIVKLIPKADESPHQVENYKAISLLEVPGKIFERIIKERLRKHLETNNLYSENQFGFRMGKGTHKALVLITEQIQSRQWAVPNNLR